MGLLDAIYPLRCQLCGEPAEDGFACPRHRIQIDAKVARCAQCFRRLPRSVLGAGLPRPPWESNRSNPLADWRRCRSCRTRSSGSAGLGRLLALGDYPGELRPWVLAFKHGGRGDLARPLAGLLARQCGAADWDADSFRRDLGEVRLPLLVPVPLASRRRFERGYDQAFLLAKALGKELGFSVARLLHRRRASPPQGEPGSRSRTANVRDAFEMARLHRRHVGDRGPLLLVDDVVSSGATLGECARVLRSTGARTIGCLALARAERAT
jgi:ComF family protein